MSTGSCARLGGRLLHTVLAEAAQALVVGGGERGERLALAGADQTGRSRAAAGAVAGGWIRPFDLGVADSSDVQSGARARRCRDSGVVFDAQETACSPRTGRSSRGCGSRPPPAAGSGSCSSSSARSPARRAARPCARPPACRPCSARRCVGGGRRSDAAGRPRRASTSALSTAARWATTGFSASQFDQLGLVARLEVGEGRAALGELAGRSPRRASPPRARPPRGASSALRGVDLGQQRAVLALVAHLGDLLLEVLELLLRVGDGALGLTALERRLGRVRLEGVELRAGGGELVVQRAHALGNTCEERAGRCQGLHGAAEMNELRDRVGHGLCSGSTWIRTRDLPVMSRLL